MPLHGLFNGLLAGIREQHEYLQAIARERGYVLSMGTLLKYNPIMPVTEVVKITTLSTEYEARPEESQDAIEFYLGLLAEEAGWAELCASLHNAGASRSFFEAAPYDAAPAFPRAVLVDLASADTSVKTALLIDGAPAPLGILALPDMDLSSSRPHMSRHAFTLAIPTPALMAALASEYQETIEALRRDDKYAAKTSCPLARAGYPPLDDLVTQPDLLTDVVETYFRAKLCHAVVGAADPTPGPRYYIERITRIHPEGALFSMTGVCYRSREVP